MEALKTGAYISVRHYAFEKSLVCPVIKSEGNRIMIFMLHGNNEILKGDAVAVTLCLHDKIYLAEAIVDDVTETYCELCIVNLNEIEEKRKHTRYKTSLSGSVAYYGTAAIMTVKNISYSGCCLNSDMILGEGIYLDISIVMEQSTMIDFMGKIVRRSQIREYIWEYGVEITSINEENRSKMQKLIGRLEDEELADIKALELIYSKHSNGIH